MDREDFLEQKTIVVVGGGAAGFFGAIAAAEADPAARVVLLEKARQLLSKVRISGGGRCNVTHACFDPAVLVQNYPRGSKELRGAFSRFQPRDTVNWFESRGVQLKVEPDGRMFPVTDSSETIISCLLSQAKAAGVAIRTECGVAECRKEERFHLVLSNGEQLLCDKLLIATGSSPKTVSLLEAFGHTFIPPVPSLFTFNIPSSPFLSLSGVSVPKVKLSIDQCNLHQTGPLLITHWGFSGPAVLKLSAWGARELHALDYHADVKVNWLPDFSQEQLKEHIAGWRQANAARLVAAESPVPLPKSLWKVLVEISGLAQETRWAGVSKQQMQQLLVSLQSRTYKIEGKSTNKEEFVTCGGVRLDEVDFKTMESRKCPGLHFAGEVLDIDGVTGGFNFQNAWTTSWIAGQAMAR